MDTRKVYSEVRKLANRLDLSVQIVKYNTPRELWDNRTRSTVELINWERRTKDPDMRKIVRNLFRQGINIIPVKHNKTLALGWSYDFKPNQATGQEEKV